MPLNRNSIPCCISHTAQLWVEYTDRDLTFLTHDRQLGFAARALGFQVMGDEEE